MAVPVEFLEPGHIPMLMLTPENYERLVAKTTRTPYFTYYAMYRAGMAISDALKIAAQLELVADIDRALPGIANTPMSLCYDAKKLTLPQLSSEVLKDISWQYKELMRLWHISIMAGAGAAFPSMGEQFRNTGQLLYAYSTLQYQSSVVPRMRRHWLSLYTPTVPNAAMAYQLLLRGKIRDSQFQEYASYDGWDREGIDFLRTVWKQIPNARAAFRLHMRGQLSLKDYVRYVEMNAWEPGWASMLYHIYEWLPNAREAWRLNRRGQISAAEMKTLFRSQGYDGRWDKVLPYMWEIWPNSSMSFRMLMRGKINRVQFNRWVMAEGWFGGAPDYLYAAYERLPSSMEAFYLHRKGIINLAERNDLYTAYGFDKRWHDKITENYQYVPTFYDLCRLADFVEIDPIWATDVMRRRGMADRDIIKCLPMLRIRPLRNEIARHVTLWLNRYKLGWVDATTFNAAMQAMLEAGWIQSREKTLITAEAELKYEDELMREEIDCLTECYISEKITQDELEESLSDLGIREEKVNLMVRLLKCRGYYGYH